MSPIGTYLAIAALIGTVPCAACTGIKLVANDGSTVHGRTLEFGKPIDTSIAFIPRGYPFVGTPPQGKGLNFKAKYAVIGAIAFDEISILDGINEKGLSVGTFYFPGFAGYTETTSENRSKSLSPTEFPNWIITQFATVEEVRAALPSVVIAPTPLKDWENAPPPLHYVVFDLSGKSIVIEPVAGQLKIYDNPLGILTNSPEFPWHMTNLRNYIHLSTTNPAPIEIDGVKLSAFGHGAGMMGMPGDFTPPSRFVRAALYSHAADIPENIDEAILQVFHVLNQFDIPKGALRGTEEGKTYYDYTLLTSARDPHNLRYYFKNYEDQSIRVVDLKAFDFNGKSVKRLPVTGKEKITDISSLLK